MKRHAPFHMLTNVVYNVQSLQDANTFYFNNSNSIWPQD